MLTKENFKIIDETVSFLTEQNNGMLAILPNMGKIAAVAEVSISDVKDYILHLVSGGMLNETN